MSESTKPASSGSLLDDPALARVGAARPAASRPRFALRRPTTPAFVRKLWARPRVRIASIAGLLLAIAIGAFLALRPTPQPDFALDDMDDVLNFTLLTDDFNALPIDKRLDLIKDLIARFNTMSGDDSSMMAMFAASIGGKLREQMERNATKLAMDMWDKFAFDYATVPSEKREVFLDQTYLDLTKTLEGLAGATSTKSDEERLEQARRQAKRDEDLFKKGQGPTASQLARLSVGMRRAVEKNSAPQQQLRAQQLMSDMTKHFRSKP
jgi:hypothetical protein